MSMLSTPPTVQSTADLGLIVFDTPLPEAPSSTDICEHLEHWAEIQRRLLTVTSAQIRAVMILDQLVERGAGRDSIDATAALYAQAADQYVALADLARGAAERAVNLAYEQREDD